MYYLQKDAYLAHLTHQYITNFAVICAIMLTFGDFIHNWANKFGDFIQKSQNKFGDSVKDAYICT